MSWAMAAGAGVSLAGNLLGGRSAKKAAQNQQRAEEQRRLAQATTTMNVNRSLAGEYAALAPEMKAAYAPQYANVDTGFATTNIDPTTGRVTSMLNAPWAAARDTLMGQGQFAGQQGRTMFDQANGFFKQAGDFNPQTFAAERYNAGQALLQPGRQLGQQGLMQDLLNKGGYGLTLNQPAAAGADANGNVVQGQGSVGVNPYVSTFLNANNAADAQMGYGSLREGQAYLDAILNRGANALGQGQSMFNLSANQYSQAGNIEGQNQNALNQAGNWSTMFNNGNVQQQNAYYKQYLAGRNLNAQSQIDYANTMWGSPTGDAGAGANNRSQMFSGIGSSLGGLIGGMNFGGNVPNFNTNIAGTAPAFGGGQTMFPNNFGVGLGGGGF